MITDAATVDRLMAPYPELFSPLYNTEDFIQGGGLPLAIGDDLAMFEEVTPGVYSGHMFYTSRGKEAAVVAKKMLAYMFLGRGARVIQALVGNELRHVKAFLRRLGFASYGYVDTPEFGTNEIFAMTDSEFKDKQWAD